MRELQIGVQLPEVERDVRWPELLAIARTAEACGFDSLWVGDHMLYRGGGREERGPWDVWTVLAALAASTVRVRLGPLVASTAFHPPGLVARMAATIDEVSGGRFVLGLGTGWNETEFRAFGIPFDHRIDRFEEAFTIIRGLLQDGAIDFEGTYYQARDCELLPRGPRAGGPPLMIGSNGERMLRITAPAVDAWNSWYSDTRNSPSGIAPLRDRVDAACRAAGRDPSKIERTVAVHVRMPGGTGRTMGSTDPEHDVRPLQGDSGSMAEELREYAREGIGHVQLVIDPIDRGAIERFAPVLRELDGR
jgi:alkanesulfonate monooxygenase SsuD/methylene tetrahydromethanopterin reductase-like flavin-dependent oxidoreductase (luciferase family)